MSGGNNIKVIARFRPQNSMESTGGGKPVVEVIEDHSAVIRNTNDEALTFTFDRTFGMETQQEELYSYSIKQTVEDVFNGYNGTVFAYGQTGSGKTYTMMGDIDDPNTKGIIPRIVEGIFNNILESPQTVEYIVKVSYMEIYMERIKDLINPTQDNLPVHEDKTHGVYVKGLVEVFVSSVEEVYDTMRQGAIARAVAQTNMNAESSRSHSIFQITIQQKNTMDGKTKIGKLSLVDLAGSEKVGKTGASGQTLEEAKKINKSLSALGMVINALTDGKSTHIPYRDSKLTRILQESLGGNSRTTLIINCSPSSYNAAETVSTLRFGTRAKNIRNKATINQALSPEELKEMIKKLNSKIISYSTYIQSLEGELKVWRGGGVVKIEEQAKWNKISKGEVGRGKDVLGGVGEQQAKKSGRTSRADAPREPPLSNRLPETNTGSLGRASGARISSPTGVEKGTLFSPLTPTFGEMVLGELRSSTPTVFGDEEREDFLKRENELADQLSERENRLKEKEVEVDELAGEVTALKDELSKGRKRDEELTAELAQLKIEKGRMEFEQKETKMTIDSLKEAQGEAEQTCQQLKEEIEKLQTQVMELENEKSELSLVKLKGFRGHENKSKDKNDDGNVVMDGDRSNDTSVEGGNAIREREMLLRQLDELKVLAAQKDTTISELKCREAELWTKYSENESQLSKVMAEYEEFLEKSITLEEEDERVKVDKVVHQKLESQLLARIEQQTKEIKMLCADKVSSEKEIQKLNQSLVDSTRTNSELHNKVDLLTKLLDDVKLANPLLPTDNNNMYTDSASSPTPTKRPSKDLSVANMVTPDGDIQLAELSPSMHDQYSQRALQAKQAEFDSIKQSLMRDVQNRCEKIIELEMALDESKQQNTQLLKRINNPTQSQRMVVLEKNITQLTMMQRELVSQNTELKKLASLNERKLSARGERIDYLENLLEQTLNDVEFYKRKYEEIHSINSRNMDKSRLPANAYAQYNHTNATSAGSSNSPLFNTNQLLYLSRLPFGRVAKPIRGGGSNISTIQHDKASADYPMHMQQQNQSQSQSQNQSQNQNQNHQNPNNTNYPDPPLKATSPPSKNNSFHSANSTFTNNSNSSTSSISGTQQQRASWLRWS